MKRRSAVLADAMGVGKTGPLIIAAARVVAEGLKHRRRCWRIVIVVPKSIVLNWQREIWAWTGERAWAYTGPKRSEIDITQSGWYVTNYGLEQELLRWDYITVLIIDEAHRALNRQRPRHQNIRSAGKRAERVWAATGTPIRKSAVDLVSMALLVGRITNYWTTVERWFATTIDPITGWEIGGVRDPKGFKRWINSFILRRSKAKALPGLPAKTRRQLFTEMTPKQQELYDQLSTDLAALVEGKLVITPTALALATRLRQLLVTPRLLGATFSGGAELLVKAWAADLRTDDRKGVIFTPFRQAIPHLKRAAVGARPAAIITGGLSISQTEAQMELFRQPDCRVALCTIQVAEGFSLVQASEALFVGASWTMAENEQAEDRLHRSGQERAVRIQYTAHANTIEERLLTILDTKTNAAAILQELYG